MTTLNFYLHHLVQVMIELKASNEEFKAIIIQEQRLVQKIGRNGRETNSRYDLIYKTMLESILNDSIIFLKNIIFGQVAR